MTPSITTIWAIGKACLYASFMELLQMLFQHFLCLLSAALKATFNAFSIMNLQLFLTINQKGGFILSLLIYETAIVTGNPK